MSQVSLLAHQFAFDQRRFWRDSPGLFYALAFPLLFLAVFAAVLVGSEENGVIAGREVDNSVYYFAAVLTMGLVSVNMVNLCVSVSGSRERGLLKRLRATPLPPWVFFAGRIGTSVFATLILIVVTSLVGGLVYGVPLRLGSVLGVVITLLASTGCFCSLGIALTVLTRGEGAAAALANLVAFPLFFISGLFVRNDIIPAAVQRVADFFPVKHAFAAFALALDPGSTGLGLHWSDLGVVVQSTWASTSSAPLGTSLTALPLFWMK